MSDKNRDEWREQVAERHGVSGRYVDISSLKHAVLDAQMLLDHAVEVAEHLREANEPNQGEQIALAIEAVRDSVPYPGDPDSDAVYRTYTDAARIAREARA